MFDKKFEASKVNPNEVLKDFGLKTSDLDKMINTLREYDLDSKLLQELISAQDRSYQSLRKWKVESFINRYKQLESKIEEIELVEDYMLELSDMGYSIKIQNYKKTIYILFPVNGENAIKKISEVMDYIKHLGNRMNINFGTIEDRRDRERTIFISVIYELKK